MIRLAGEREEIRVVADQVGSPTMTRDLAVALFRLLRTEAYGLYHFADDGQCSWYDFAVAIVGQLRINGKEPAVKRILPITTAEYPLPAKRPAFSVFSKNKYRAVTGAAIPHWQDSLREYLEMREASRREGKNL